MADISGINSGNVSSFLSDSIQNPSEAQNSAASQDSVSQTGLASSAPFHNVFQLSQLISNETEPSPIHPTDASSAESQILSSEKFKTLEQANGITDDPKLAQSLLDLSVFSLESLTASMDLLQEAGISNVVQTYPSLVQSFLSNIAPSPISGEETSASSSSSNSNDTLASTSSLPATSAAAQAYLDTAQLPLIPGSRLNQEV